MPRPLLLRLAPLWLRTKLYYHFYRGKNWHADLFHGAPLEFAPSARMDLHPSDEGHGEIAFTGCYELALTRHAQENDHEAAARHEAKKGAPLQALQSKQAQLKSLKTRRKTTAKHIQIKDLPPEQRVARLRGGRKHFIDTIKLIAYRAEAALV